MKEEKEIKSLDDLLDELNRLDSEKEEKMSLTSGEEMPESLNQKKKDDIVIDEDREREKIENELSLDADMDKQKIESDYENNVKTLENSKEIYKNNAENAKNDIAYAYDKAKISSTNDSLKRGLARSSIAALSIANLSDSEAKEYSRVAGTLSANLSKIEEEINNLARKKDESLKNIDITLAKNIDKKLAEKLDELKKEQDKVIEYNNKINALEQNYQADRVSKLSSQKKQQYEFENKYGEEILKDIKKQQMDTTLNYLNTLPKSEAIKTLITSPELAKILGDYFYDIYYIESRR